MRHTQVFDAAVAAAFQDVGEPHDIGIHVGLRVYQGITDTGLGSQVNNGVEGVFPEKCLHCRPVGKVCFLEGEVHF